MQCGRGLEFRVQGLGFRVWGLVGIQDFVFRTLAGYQLHRVAVPQRNLKLSNNGDRKNLQKIMDSL